MVRRVFNGALRELHCPRWQPRLGHGEGPAHSGTLHPVLHQVPAGAFDRATGDGVTVPKIAAVAHAGAVAVIVSCHSQDGRLLLPFELSFGRHLTQAFDDLTDA